MTTSPSSNYSSMQSELSTSQPASEVLSSALFLLSNFFERFAFYGVRWALVLYFVMEIAPADFDSKNQAQMLYSGFLGLLAVVGLLGAYIADRFASHLQAALSGALLMGLGMSLLLVADASMFRLGLASMVLGNGLYRPVLMSLLGSSFGDNEAKRDAGFVVAYMLTNLAGFVAPMLTQHLASKVFKVDDHISFKSVFIVAALSMLSSFFCVLWMTRQRGVAQARQLMAWKPIALAQCGGVAMLGVLLLAYLLDVSVASLGIVNLVGLIVAAVILVRTARGETDRGSRPYVFLLVLAAVCIAQIVLELSRPSVDLVLNGWLGSTALLPFAPQMQAVILPVIFIVASAPILALGLFILGRHFYPNLLQRMGWVMLITTVSLGLVYFAAQALLQGQQQAVSLGMPSLLSMLASQAAGEILLTALSFSMVFAYAPRRHWALALAMVFLITRSGSQIAGYLLGTFPALQLQANQDAPLHLRLACICLGLLVISTWIGGRLLKRLQA